MAFAKRAAILQNSVASIGGFRWVHSAATAVVTHETDLTYKELLSLRTADFASAMSSLAAPEKPQY